jgi:hypothetical protein
VTEHNVSFTPSAGNSNISFTPDTALTDIGSGLNIGNIVSFVLVGLGIGAILALLFAPQTKDVRHEVGKAIEKGIDNGSDTASHTLKQLEKEFKTLRKQVEKSLSR